MNQYIFKCVVCYVDHLDALLIQSSNKKLLKLQGMSLS